MDQSINLPPQPQQSHTPQPINEKPRPKFFSKVIGVLTFLFIVFLYVVFQGSFNIEMHGNSMSPNYLDNAYYSANPFPVWTKQVKRGDVVAITNLEYSNMKIVKRIIGIPGDTVMLQDGQVFLNGTLLSEPYLQSGIKTYGSDFLEEKQFVTVPTDHYFILGDNRPESADSRTYGFVSKQRIISKVGKCSFRCTE